MRLSKWLEHGVSRWFDQLLLSTTFGLVNTFRSAHTSLHHITLPMSFTVLDTPCSQTCNFKINIVVRRLRWGIPTRSILCDQSGDCYRNLRVQTMSQFGVSLRSRTTYTKGQRSSCIEDSFSCKVLGFGIAVI